MLNVIRMDLYRMFKCKYTYIVLVAAMFMMFASVFGWQPCSGTDKLTAGSRSRIRYGAEAEHRIRLQIVLNPAYEHNQRISCCLA